MQCRCTAGLGGSPVGGTERRSTSFDAAAGFVTRIGSVAGFGLNARHSWYHHADFVRLRRSGSPVLRHSPASGRSGDRDRLLSDRERPERVAVGPAYNPSSGPARWRVRLCRVAVGRSMPASLGPVVYRLAERLELVGVVVPAADAGELFDDVTELLDVDGVAASPAIPLVERFDLSSQAATGRGCGGAARRMSWRCSAVAVSSTRARAWW